MDAKYSTSHSSLYSITIKSVSEFTDFTYNGL
jgi:hypothetical protein